jgi:RpiR family transcriptional regulator, glv operon transcriptional regulator
MTIGLEYDLCYTEIVKSCTRRHEEGSIATMLDEMVYKKLGQLSETDQIIWKYIFLHKKEVANMSIQDLADVCHVSRTTVMRFTQKISLSGFSELKALLKLEEKQRPSFDGADVISRIARQYQSVINDLQKRNFEPICRLIATANRIIGFGTGVIQSNVIRELKRLFIGSGEFIYTLEGKAEFEYLVHNLKKGDLLFIVSLSGETPYVVDHLDEIRLKDIPIISITQFEDNTLAHYSTENIFIATPHYNAYANKKNYSYVSMTVFYTVAEILFLQYQLYKDTHSAESNNDEKTS